MLIQSVPVNVITGFLGSGKTSFIKRLLASRPEGEQWAVLVNEFGEIGLDAALLSDEDSPGKVTIKEVPGGCMCCAAGVPTQVAVTQLLSRVNPDRLLIEPTGLGHPAEILKMLGSDFLSNALSLKSTFCLVDARKLADSRYSEHEIFRQQLSVADVVLASKADTYESSPQQMTELTDFLAGQWVNPQMCLPLDNQYELDDRIIEALNITAKKPAAIKAAKQAQTGMLSASTSLLFPPANQHNGWGQTQAADEPEPLEFNEQGICEKSNQGDGFVSHGWVFTPDYCFDFDKLVQLIRDANLTRLKAVMITLDGIAAFNLVDGDLNINELDDAMDSRIEIISDQPIEQSFWQQQLLQCRASEC